MPVLLEQPRTRPARRAAGGDGGWVGAGSGAFDGGGSGPRRQWPLALSVLAVALLAALLTLLGMYTQIQANLTGAQLPGS